MSVTRHNPLPDLNQCPCAGGTLDKLIRPAVLTVLASGELHGYAIVQRLAGMSMFRGQSPDATGVYRTLRSLSRQRMVSCAWDVSGSGPAKRLYRLTKTGRRCLDAWVRTLDQYRRAVGELLTAARGAARRLVDPPARKKGLIHDR
jgi:poly-beta-hydroxybutyrate-responsive repressor